jgi:hypothetical protein
LMASWDVQPAGCGQVVTGSVKAASEYESDLSAVDTVVGEALGALMFSPLVSKRVGEVVPMVADSHVEAVVGHTDAAVRGTVDAVESYVAGDGEMAARAQRHATLVVYPVDAPGVVRGLTR